jgi:hypothetical protein
MKTRIFSLVYFAKVKIKLYIQYVYTLMNQYIITGGGTNHTYGVLPPLFHDLGEYFHSMKGGTITDSEHMNHVAVPMSLLSAGAVHNKKRDYEEINDDEVIKDELYDKLLELLQVKNSKKTSRKKRKTILISTEVKKRNNTRKNI